MILKQFKDFINTPNLWESNLLEVEQFEIPEINLNLFNPKPIPQNVRLGHQIEYIFHQLIEYSGQYRILLFNQPVKNENRTIGEIDFILKNQIDDSILHIELTYKFYIIDEALSNPILQLIGPNRKDSFFDKINKIKNHQFKLIQKEETIKILKYNEIETNDIVSQACFKAQLFIPFHKKDVNITPFNKECIYGFWIKKVDFSGIDFLNNKYYLPLKKEWLINPYENVIWKTHELISIEIDQQHLQLKSPMVWMKNSSNEIEKAIIVWW